MSEPRWYSPIRDLFFRSFDEPWHEHLMHFNRRPTVARSGVEFFLPHRQCPPAWFNGDIEVLEPGKWVLVASLNPHIDPTDGSLSRQDFMAQGWWDYWRRFNRGNNWKGDFFPSLVRLASRCLGEETADRDINGFATERMLFVEFCPYASAGFPDLKWEAWKDLAATDPAFGIAQQIRQIIFDFGQPALVLCNGKFATWDVKDRQFGVHNMERLCAEVAESPGGQTWYYEGVYRPREGQSFLVLGFNQINRQFVRSEVRMREREVLIRAARPDLRHTLRVDPCPYSWER